MNRSAAVLASLPLAASTLRLRNLQRAALATEAPAWEPHPHQLPPEGDWRIWLLLGGRGAGKTRAGSEWVTGRVVGGHARRVALVGPTAADVRDVMVEGESGILACAPAGFRPEYEPSKRRLTWPNGALATTYSADEPDRLRGPQHDLAWCDEVAAWRFPAAWDMLLFGLRLGTDPRLLATTTPRPVRLIRDLMAPDRADVAVRRGSTYANRDHLAPAFMEQILRRYEGTRLGRQEIEAELLADVPGALWTRATLDDGRVTRHPELARVVVAVDPEASSAEGAAETGIVVAGLGTDGHGYVLADLSLRASPATWGAAVVAAYHTHAADRVLGEVNNGGEMIERVIRTTPGGDRLPYTALHASRGKQARAEPVAGLYEQGRVHHVGVFPDLEDQLCNWVQGAGASPDRLDALVWALTALLVQTGRLETRTVGVY